MFFHSEEEEDHEYRDHTEVSLLLDGLLQGYDNNLRPDFGGDAILLSFTSQNKG